MKLHTRINRKGCNLRHHGSTWSWGWRHGQLRTFKYQRHIQPYKMRFIYERMNKLLTWLLTKSEIYIIVFATIMSLVLTIPAVLLIWWIVLL